MKRYASIFAILGLLAGFAPLDAQGCESIDRCSEDLNLVDTISYDPLVIEYVVLVYDGEGTAEPYGPTDRLWYMLHMENCEVGGICTEFSQIVEFDPTTCDTIRTIRLPGEIVGSGLAYDPLDGSFWYSKSFYSDELFHVDSVGDPIGSYGAEFNIMGLAIDAENRHLWGIIQGDPDMLVEYDLSGGAPVLIQGPIQVPWQSASSWAAAGLDYNEDSDMLIAINAMSGTMECLVDFDPGVFPACVCTPTETQSPFGVAQVGGPETTYLANSPFLGPFPVDVFSSCISYFCGEINGDGAITTGDGFALLNYFGSSSEILDFRGADLNGDDAVTTGDGFQLLNYFGSSGPGLTCDEPCCENCP